MEELKLIEQALNVAASKGAFVLDESYQIKVAIERLKHQLETKQEEKVSDKKEKK